MKQKIKEYWKCNGIYYIKKWKPIVSSVRNILLTKIMLEKLNKID